MASLSLFLVLFLQFSNQTTIKMSNILKENFLFRIGKWFICQNIFPFNNDGCIIFIKIYININDLSPLPILKPLEKKNYILK